jgi:hypothetical protein
VHPGETITFTDSYPMHDSDDGVLRYDGEPYDSNTITHVFHPFNVWIISLCFDDVNNDPIRVGYDLERVTYNSLWGMF